MNDQQAGIARPEHGHRPGGQTMPAEPDASGARPPDGRTDRLPRADRLLRAGRLRGRPMVAALVGLAVAISGCAASSSATSPSAAVPAAAGQTATRPAAEQSATPSAEQPVPQTPAGQVPDLPAPDVAIPTDPSRLARSLTTTTAQLRRAVDDWVRDGDPGKGQPPEPVVLLALHQQRVYRYLVRNPKVASRTYAKLPKALAGPAKDNVTAGRNLRSLVRPISGAAKFRVQPPEPADVLLGHFRRAERKFGVEWEVLAAVMFVETKFGRVRSPSHTGAKGPMQFMPGTWAAYGMGGDIQDSRDALLAAANYLHASGAPRDYRRALYAYNHSQAYVDAVLLHARQIKQDIRNYYAYYSWQVFVVTTRGDRRLTGP
ncbi:lytic transglycosylase domain-containing protein [Streptosporangium canum]|uniref:lytic transglycosylase domain-containing protein n=1 Tax=Streptosporangium canum TaxID=324952 RepID=UPI0037B1A4A1